MENKKHEKEPEISLKQARLKMLLAVLDAFGEDELSTVRSWLINFKDSIPSNSKAGKTIEEKYIELSNVYCNGEEERQSITRQACEKPGKVPGIPEGSDPNQWLEKENKKYFRVFLRDLNKACWNVGSDWDLIPKE